MVPTGEAVIAGYAQGHIVWWESRTAQPIKSLSEEIPDPILRVAIMHDVYRAVSCNNVGAVKLYMMNRVMMKWVCRVTTIDHKLPFLVTDIATVCLGDDATPVVPNTQSSNDVLHYVAIACKDACKVYQVKFGLQIESIELFSIKSPTQRLEALSSTALAWKKANQQLDDPNQVRPHTLCIAWGTTVVLYSLLEGASGLDAAGVLTIPFAPSALHHFTSDCMLGLSTVGEVVVFDARNAAIVDWAATDVEPLAQHHSLRKKSIMQQHSTGSDGTTSYISSAQRLMMITIRTWEDRINALQVAKKWIEALDLGLQCFNNTAVGVVGLSDIEWTRKEQVCTKMISLIEGYIHYELQTFNASKQSPDPTNRIQFFYKLGKTAVSYCISIRSYDMLFGPVFAAFSRDKQENTFVYVLEEFITFADERNRLTTMPEFFVDALIDLFLDVLEPYKELDVATNATATRTKLSSRDRAEHCLMRLQDSVEYALRKSTQYGMYRAVCMLHCTGMMEYSISMTQLLAIDKPASIAVMLEYMMLLYKGETFVSGVRIPQAALPRVHADIVIHACAATSMSKLLHVNVRDYLNLLDLLLYDQDVWDNVPSETTRQGVVECLMKTTIDTTIPPLEPWGLMKKPWPKFEEITDIFIHLLKYFKSKIVVFENVEAMLTRAFAVLTYNVSSLGLPPEELKLRQEVLNGALRARHRPVLDWRQIQTLAEGANFHSVIVVIYEIQGKHKTALQFLVRNASASAALKEYVFTYLDTSLTKFASAQSEDLTTLSNAIVAEAEQLVEIDGSATAQLVISHLSRRHHEIFKNLSSVPKTQFKYLYGLVFTDRPAAMGMPLPSPGSTLSPTDSIRLSNVNFLTAAGTTTSGHMARDLDELKSLDIDFYEPETLNRFLTLLCEYHPDVVYNFLLQHHQKLATQYDIELMIKMCETYKVIDAQTFLLEQTKQLTEAMKVLIVSLSAKVQKMRKDILAGTISGELSMLLFPEVKRFLDVGVQLCVRNSTDLDSDERECHNLWFTLLDRFAKPRQALVNRLKCDTTSSTLSASEEDFVVFNELEADTTPVPQPKAITTTARDHYHRLHGVYTQYMKYILSFMMEHLPPASIWGKIQRDHPMDTYGEFRQILSDILKHFTYSLAATTSCYRIMKNDIYRLGDELKTLYTRPINVPFLSESCQQCAESLGSTEGVDLRFYSCGHGFHKTCNPYDSCVACNTRDVKRSGGADRGSLSKTVTMHADTSKMKEKLDEKAIKKIVVRLDRVRRRLDVGVDLRQNMDGRSKIGLRLNPLGTQMMSPDVDERVAGKLPKKSDVNRILRAEELVEIFGEEVLEGLKERKTQREKKKQVEEKRKKIMEGNVAWDEDDTEALAWDS